LADALLGSPPILLLDEPTSGLDPNQILDVRELIRDLAKDHAIILSTHVLSEVEATCSRAIVIHQGRVVAQGPLDGLRNGPLDGKATVLVDGDEERIRGVLGSRLIDLERTGSQGHGAPRFSARLKLGDDVDVLGRIVKSLVEADVVVLEARRTRDALDEIFAQLTGREADSNKVGNL
jgi:ABC-2 type transport system ATP-binding protein